MTNANAIHSLGVFSEGGKVFLFYYPFVHKKSVFSADSSSDGFDFHKFYGASEIKDEKKRRINIKQCHHFRIAQINHGYFLTYTNRSKKRTYLYGAFSKDCLHWQKTGKISTATEVGMVVPNYKYSGQYVLYFGESSILLAFSRDLTTWEIAKTPILKPDKNHSLIVGNLILKKEGIVLVYFAKERLNGASVYSLKAALFDQKDPKKLLWQLEKPIWEQPEEWSNKNISPIGVIEVNGRFISYWESKAEGIFAVLHSPVKQVSDFKAYLPAAILERIRENPVLQPIVNHFWESKAVFNPAAIYEDGKVHIIYRAIGDQDTSVLGYATSRDGIHIDERLDEPIYVPSQPFECGDLSAPICPTLYTSGGGGYGGCEDPRIVKIDDRLYMTYVAHNSRNPPRIALTSIRIDDFLNQSWRWETPVLISPPGVVDKNACILPEKIKGKYVIFHRIFPNILIDFVDDLEFDGETRWLKGEFSIKPRRDSWDSRKVGIGAPPLKTKDGWLVIYQAIGDQDPGRYKMGAMLLELNNPAQVLYRSNNPILEPVERYENEGFKSGVVYPCGAVTIQDKLFVYYGGADMVVCVATANLNKFLAQLKDTGSARLEPINIRPFSH